MLSVSEQIQNYRAMKALETRQTPEMSAEMPARTTNPIVLYRHPKTKEFFLTLMQRWNKNYHTRHQTAAKARTPIHN